MAVAKSKSNLQARLDAAAFVLLVSGIIVTICIVGSVLSHDVSRHPLGAIGDWLGSGLFQSLGVGSYVLAIGWFAISITLFFALRFRRWLVRLVGWLLLLLATS